MSTKIHYRDYNPKQLLLFPERLDKDIDENDPVRIVDKVVDNLKAVNFNELYSTRGRCAYHPKMMMKVILYGYMNNLYSCRKIASALKRDIHFIWLAGYEQPDHNTINRFRERVKEKINEVFTLLVLELAERGFITLDVEYIDGTKIESKANRYTFVWRDAMNNGQTKPGYNLQIGTENQFILDFGLFQTPGDTTTMIPFLESFRNRYGRHPSKAVADSGYGSEENYHFMEEADIEAYVKYNWFHREQRMRYEPAPFSQPTLHYNEEKDYYVCPMGQHMTRIGTILSKTETGYITEQVRYRAQRCEGCPLRGSCFKGKGDRTIEVNYRMRKYREQARDRLLSEEGVRHRGRRCIEPEAVFGQMKYDMAYKRFRHFGLDKVKMDFAFFAIAFNIKKMCRISEKRRKNDSKRTFHVIFFVFIRPLSHENRIFD